MLQLIWGNHPQISLFDLRAKMVSHLQDAVNRSFIDGFWFLIDLVPNVDVSGLSSEIIRKYIFSEDIKGLQRFLSDDRTRPQHPVTTVLHPAIRSRNSEIIKILIKYPLVQISLDVFILAMERRDYETFYLLLDRRDNLTLCGQNHLLYETAIKTKAPEEILEVLMKLVDPNCDHSPLITIAAHCNNLNAIRTLLTYAQPSFELIEFCIHFRQLNIFMLLVSHPHLDLTANDQILFRLAVEYNNIPVLDYFLTQTPVQPQRDQNFAIRLAVQWSRKEALEILMKDPRTDPSDHFNEAYRMAILKNDGVLASILYADPRVQYYLEESHFP
eukprot:TRINITY_DN5663_c0_g1_i6.p1 TRINITY_DN5663_c0_g1~~TRINITY_DN5663_c0_g1_i6.p1  ORF type:complete len:329 (-),score=45.45 TRINITY_DN5663_c0_g1_i6:33-1019(-)